MNWALTVNGRSRTIPTVPQTLNKQLATSHKPASPLTKVNNKKTLLLMSSMTPNQNNRKKKARPRHIFLASTFLLTSHRKAAAAWCFFMTQWSQMHFKTSKRSTVCQSVFTTQNTWTKKSLCSKCPCSTTSSTLMIGKLPPPQSTTLSTKTSNQKCTDKCKSHTESKKGISAFTSMTMKCQSATKKKNTRHGFR